MSEKGLNLSKTFLHFSDAHIGHRQYGVKKRRDDMYRSFNTAIQKGLDENIDFAVFSGDLFHNRNVKARHLADAEKCLDRFSEAEVPIICVKGNHDSKLYKEDLTWLEYLHSKDKIIFLEANLKDDGSIFVRHDFGEPGTSSGYVDLEGIRVFGLQYMGQRTGKLIEDVARGIRRVNEAEGEAEMTILLGHFGVEGHIPGISGGVSFDQLRPLEGLVDYLGLGHLHKQYSHDDWVFNPGSLEAHDAREAKWKHGYYIVDVVDDSFDYEFNYSFRRPFFSFDFIVDDYNSPEELEKGFKQKIDDVLPDLEKKQQIERFMAGNNTRKPVVDLHLKGLLQFSRSRLDIDWIRSFVEEKMKALYVNMSDATESKETASILEELDESEVKNDDGQINRNKLESAIFQKLAGQDSRFNDEKKEVAKTFKMIKHSLAKDESPESAAKTIKDRRRELFSDVGGDDE